MWFSLSHYIGPKIVQIITLESVLLACSGALEWLHLDLILTKHLDGNILILFCGVIYCKLNIKW